MASVIVPLSAAHRSRTSSRPGPADLMVARVDSAASDAGEAPRYPDACPMVPANRWAARPGSERGTPTGYPVAREMIDAPAGEGQMALRARHAHRTARPDAMISKRRPFEPRDLSDTTWGGTS